MDSRLFVAYSKGLHLQKYEYVFICTHVHVCMHMEAKGQPLDVFPQSLPILFFETSLSLIWSLSIRINWLAIEH